MKLQFYKNIDVVQINVKAGVSEYYFPKNVDWADKKIDKLVVYGSNPETGELSPIDGITPIYDREMISSIYFDIYAEDNSQIAYNVAANNIIHTNNYPLEVNSKLSLQTTKMVFSEAPEDDGCVLIYVFWDTQEIDTDIPNHSVTIQFPIKGGQELPLAQVIDAYIHSQAKTVKGISVWGGYGYWSYLFITLRDHNNKTIIKSLPAGMCRPQMGVDSIFEGNTISSQVQSVQVHPMYLDMADIDFDNSFVYYASSGAKETPITITFLY